MLFLFHFSIKHLGGGLYACGNTGLALFWCGNPGFTSYLCGNPGMKKRAEYVISHRLVRECGINVISVRESVIEETCGIRDYPCLVRDYGDKL